MGVSPKWQNGSRSVGAVYVYKRFNNEKWELRSVIKSTHPDVGNHFGSSIAMCGTGHPMGVAGEEGDDSQALEASMAISPATALSIRAR